jgi:hypothetical protein
LTTRSYRSSTLVPSLPFGLLALCLLSPPVARCQTPPLATPPPAALQTLPSAATSAPVETTLLLPDSPGYTPSTAPAASDADDTPAAPWYIGDVVPTTSPRRIKHTSLYDKYIDDIEIPRPLTARDKVILGVRASVTPYSLISIVAAAGYEQFRNGNPNYGTDSGAFGQRVGAAALRGTSEELFTDSLFAPIFHQDPRYYELGQGHTVFARTTYALSRVFVSRHDDGSPMPNYALLAGYASGAALTNAYYPSVNRGALQTAETFGGSLGGAAFSFVFREFIDQALYSIHLGKNNR